ncbi:MAG: hypothetical protein ACPG5B_12725 [Chitinophagales bacterium]
MKVAELRKKLAPLKKEELIKLAVEFYKLVPKAKKEDYQLDEMVNNPSQPKPKKKCVSMALSLSEVENLVKKFEEDAKEQNYLYPNRSVPKKERSTWRFKVKKWYKELVNVKRKDADLPLQAVLLEILYELLSEGGYHNYFTSQMPFKSIGISQADFYKSVLFVWQEAEGKQTAIEKGIPLLLNHSLDEDTYFNDLSTEFISCLPIPDLKELAIAAIKAEIKTLNYIPISKESVAVNGFGYYFDTRTVEEKNEEKRHVSLMTLAFQLYVALYEPEEAIAFYKKYYYEEKVELKLYVLIALLFDKGLKDEMKEELENAKKDDITLIEELPKILEYIKKYDSLPEDFYYFEM